MKLEKDRTMDWFTVSLLALLAPMPFIAAVIITAIIVLAAAQATTLLYRWFGRVQRSGFEQAKALAN